MIGLLRQVRRRGLRASVALLRARFDKLDFVQFNLRGKLLLSRVTHVSGPATIETDNDVPVVISVMRNGMLWLPSFLAHHRALGVQSFVLLDNGSTDGSIEFLEREPDVTLLRSDVPYKAYENTMKRYLAERFCDGRWCLCVDVDELFDYPGSGTITLAEFCAYLDRIDANAVITQMLDMFRKEPLGSFTSHPGEDLIETYPWYDAGAIETWPYNHGSVPPEIRMHTGGVRRRVFGTNNGLTKVSLFRMDGRLKPFIAWHHAKNARLADISCVLLHFPFVSGFLEKVEEAAQSGRYGYVTTDEYQRYDFVLRQRRVVDMTAPDMSRFGGTMALVQQGFLVISKRFTDYLAETHRTAPGLSKAPTPEKAEPV